MVGEAGLLDLGDLTANGEEFSGMTRVLGLIY